MRFEGIPSDEEYFLQLSACTLSLCAEVNCSEDRSLCVCLLGNPGIHCDLAVAF